MNEIQKTKIVCIDDLSGKRFFKRGITSSVMACCISAGTPGIDTVYISEETISEEGDDDLEERTQTPGVHK